MKKVLLGMSGGVDSSVSAVVLQQLGYSVSGVTLKLYDGESSDDGGKTCCSLNDVLDARSVCDRLGIRHYVFNFKERFDREVISRFVDQYEAGFTPNPCIECNRYIKFREMLDRAILLEQDFIATGHYVKKEFDTATGRFLLKRPADRNKDQTYVVYDLTQDQLKQTLFPLGDLTKTQVREIAEENGFVNAHKPDSQDICFIPDGDYAKFIEEYTGIKQQCGDYLDIEGRVIGKHKGAVKYTLGQRKGLGIALGKPQFIISKSMADNTVTLGDEKYLFKNKAVIKDCRFIPFDVLDRSVKVTAKVRYRQKDEPAVIHPLNQTDVLLEFDQPQRAVTPGQAAVFYDGDTVVGGGTISEVK